MTYLESSVTESSLCTFSDYVVDNPPTFTMKMWMKRFEKKAELRSVYEKLRPYDVEEMRMKKI